MATEATPDEDDQKHKKYFSAYLPGDEFWGIGLENETYIEMTTKISVPARFLLEHQRRERYSVNYWMQYKPDALKRCLESWISEIGSDTQIELPLLLNGHSITKCDQWGEHTMTYEVNPKPNPKFSKKTLLNALETHCPSVFGPAAKDVWWTFDGDTVEFMTQNFYCAKMEDVIWELRSQKATWMRAFRGGLESLPRRETFLKSVPRWPRKNYGFAVFASNRRNVAIFNNGTYHVNLTLPTVLDKDGAPADWPKFVRDHQKAARLFQWLTPFLIAKWGSPDPFSFLDDQKNRKNRTIQGIHRKQEFPTGSQRLAASRYVSAGMYDTRKMPTGKILTKPRDEIEAKKWWEDMFAAPDCAYQPLEYLGFDINFHKFRNHGLEFRIFDWFPEKCLDEVLRMLIWMLDAVVRQKTIPVPQESAVWNRLLGSAIWSGAATQLSEADCLEIGKVLGVFMQTDASGYLGILEAYQKIWNRWADMFDGRGPVSRKMIRAPLLRPQPIRWRAYMIEECPRERKNSPLIQIVRLKSQWKIRFKPKVIPKPPVWNPAPVSTELEIKQTHCLFPFFRKRC